MSLGWRNLRWLGLDSESDLDLDLDLGFDFCLDFDLDLDLDLDRDLDPDPDLDLLGLGSEPDGSWLGSPLCLPRLVPCPLASGERPLVGLPLLSVLFLCPSSSRDFDG